MQSLRGFIVFFLPRVKHYSQFEISWIFLSLNKVCAHLTWYDKRWMLYLKTDDLYSRSVSLRWESGSESSVFLWCSAAVTIVGSCWCGWWRPVVCQHPWGQVEGPETQELLTINRNMKGQRSFKGFLIDCKQEIKNKMNKKPWTLGSVNFERISCVVWCYQSTFTEI